MILVPGLGFPRLRLAIALLFAATMAVRACLLARHEIAVGGNAGSLPQAGGVAGVALS